MRQSAVAMALLAAGLLSACGSSKPTGIVAAQANGGSVQICVNASGLTPNGAVAVHALWPSPPIEPISAPGATASSTGTYNQLTAVERSRCSPVGTPPSYPDVDFFIADLATSNLVIAPVKQGYFCPSVTPQPGPDPNWAKCCAGSGLC
jgi:hypothetical protein